MGRTHDELAGCLDELAAWTTLAEGSAEGFRVRAWKEAARAVRGLGPAALTMEPAQLHATPGLGRASVEVIVQWRDGGPVERLERLRAEHPPGILELLRVPGLGPKLVRSLHDVLGIGSVASLRAAIDDGRLGSLPGVGQATVDALRAALRLDAVDRIPLADVLEALPGVDVAGPEAAVPAGAVLAGAARRGLDHLEEVVIVASEPLDVTGLHFGVPARVVVIEDPRRAGWDLVVATGPDDHVRELVGLAAARGMTLDPDGLRDADGAKVMVEDEDALYRALGLYRSTPERRDSGDGLADRAGPAPLGLVQVEDLRGDLHVHTTWSGDGRSSLPDMLAALHDRGFAYAAITDHAEDLRINGLTRERMLEQRAELERLADTYDGLRILHGAELNIDATGSVDYDAEFLTGFDWCVASVHSSFRRPSQEQTKRLVAAIHNPSVTAIGHLTGRMLGRREGIAFDLDAVLTALSETGTALEINSSPRRLDAPAEVVAEAVARGVNLVISTDAHHVDALANAAHGVRLARRAGVTAEQVVNTWPVQRFLGWVSDVGRV